MASNKVSAALRKVAKNITDAPAKFARLMKARGSNAAPKALAMLQREPGSPRYPIRWTTERQRKAFFATDGFGRGIPTRRSGEIKGAWKVEFIPDSRGGMLVLSNEHPAARFVQGFDQQGFHADTGWVTTAQASDEFFAQGGYAVTEAWYEAADPLEGV